jgi:outer membrane lipoprotein-sorting protein
MVPIHSYLAEEGVSPKSSTNSGPESQRDSGSKPGVARNELPRVGCASVLNPNGVVSRWGRHVATPLGLLVSHTFSQGSSFLATLGWRTQSRWDCSSAALIAGSSAIVLPQNFQKSLRFGRFFLGLLLLTFTVALSRAGDYDAQFNKWFEVQTNLQNWSGEFTQTRTLSVLNQPLITPGKVWVKPGEFRWELGQPVQSIILRTPDALLIVYPRFKRAEKYSLGVVPSGPMKDALALMDASLPRDRATMEEHFKLISADLTNSILQMTLQPRSESARKMIGQVKIGFHTNDYLIAETEMKFADGSTLHNNFTNLVVNQPLAPELFDEKLPADYTVSEPLKQ